MTMACGRHWDASEGATTAEAKRSGSRDVRTFGGRADENFCGARWHDADAGMS